MLQEITIQFTEQCNLSCSYCFASGKTTGMLSQDDFNTFLNFCLKEKMDVIHITGGEPSLNPHFSYFVSKLAEISSLVVYTNFTTKDEIKGIICEKASEIVFLVNITSQKFCPIQEKENMYNNIKAALDKGFRVALSYTFFDSRDSIENQFNYLISLIKRYDLRNLRISQALNFNEQDKFINKEVLKTLYHYVACNIEKWKQIGLSVYFDCPIPPCYVEKQDFTLLRKYNAVSIKCIPKVFVMYDMKVTHCYSTMEYPNESYLHSFSDLADARQYTTNILNEAYLNSQRFGCTHCHFDNDGIPCGCPSYCI